MSSYGGGWSGECVAIDPITSDKHAADIAMQQPSCTINFIDLFLGSPGACRYA